MLEIHNLSVRYAKQSPALKAFSLKVKKGEIVGIVGESGSGKTTVLRSIIGALPKESDICSGAIHFLNQPLLQKSQEEWNQLRGTKMSIIFQDTRATLNPIAKIGVQFTDYICTHTQLSKEEAFQLSIEILKKMHLPKGETIMNQYPHQLSGGMCQRVGIAMAMVLQPQLLLADEPTSALDVTTQAQIVRELLQMREQFGTSIVFVTHNLGLAYFLADHLLIMKDGVVVEQGDKESVIHNSTHPYTQKLLAADSKLGVKNHA